MHTKTEHSFYLFLFASFLELLYNTNIFQNLGVIFFVQIPGYRATTTLLKVQHKTTREIYISFPFQELCCN